MLVGAALHPWQECLRMSDAASTLALVVYPGLWDTSCELHPRSAAGYDWREHLRTLCRLARAIHEAQPVILRVAGEAEKMHVEALAYVPVELLILDVQRDRLSRAGLPDDELWWLNPYDSHLKSEPASSRSAGRSRPDAYI
jgi:hypothetical protein